jgi:hypothetical protein
MRRSSVCILIGMFGFACDSGSIGQDVCLGEHTRCDAKAEAGRVSVWPYPTREYELETSDLPRLEPSFEHTLSFPDARAEADSTHGGVLTGSGEAGLWYLKERRKGQGIAVHTLDENGELSDSTVLEPPDSAHFSGVARDKPIIDSGAFFRPSKGDAPVISVRWYVPCDRDPSPACTQQAAVETVAFAADLEESPLRILHGQGQNGLDVSQGVARCDDGGLWLFAPPHGLRKYDAQGEIEIQQTLLRTAFPGLSGLGGVGGQAQMLMATTPSQSLYLYSVDTFGAYKIWLLDEHGNPLWSGNPGSAARPFLTTDVKGRAVLFAEDYAGDLIVQRFDALSGESETQRALRDDFTMLEPRQLAEDRAGNLYVLTYSGARNSPVPTLCKLPVDGDLACYAVPALRTHTPMLASNLPNSASIVGGADGVIYGFHSASQPGSELSADLLQRFDVP